VSERPSPAPRPTPQPIPQAVPQLLPKLKPLAVAVALTAIIATGAVLFLPTEESLTPAEEAARVTAFEAAQPIPLEPVNLADPAEREEALTVMNLNPEERKALENNLLAQAERLVWLDVLDDCQEDGDIVNIKSSSFHQDVAIFHAPRRLAVTLAPSEKAIALTGIKDGVGGITVSVRVQGRIVPLPRLSPGQTMMIPVM
jgi:hypothetical protein